jgi:hypothetical protein
MLDEYTLFVKSHKKNQKSIETRLEEYIEFAENTKRFSDAGFYREVLHYIEELKNNP